MGARGVNRAVWSRLGRSLPSLIWRNANRVFGRRNYSDKTILSGYAVIMSGHSEIGVMIYPYFLTKIRRTCLRCNPLPDRLWGAIKLSGFHSMIPTAVLCLYDTHRAKKTTARGVNIWTVVQYNDIKPIGCDWGRKLLYI